MTQEEKAKAYDKALEKARLILQERGDEPDGASVLSDLFPELAESEDERIRKAILKHFREYEPTCYFNGCFVKDIIAWLEKQGEQKPAWSEEDENLLGFTLSNLAELKDRYGEGYGKVGECIKWLKSLRPQSKNEWDKNDELNRQDTIRLLTDAKERYLQTDASIPKCIKWLENLSPQSHWKPSDEQMKILNEVLNFAANHESPHWNDCIFGTLNNLIRQLKKLKV